MRCVKAILQGIRKCRGANNNCVIVLGTALRRYASVHSYAALSPCLTVFHTFKVQCDEKTYRH